MSASTPLPRCTMPGCAWRYRGGPDRPCQQHRDDGGDVHAAAEALGIAIGELAATAPGDRGSEGRRAGA